MPYHISKRLTEAQAVTILTHYRSGTIRAREARAKLGLQRSQFFNLVARFRNEGSSFTLAARSDHAHRRIAPEIEERLARELAAEKNLIDDPTIPIRSYNYSALRDLLWEKHGLAISVPTIIARAKALGCYMPRAEQRRHERIVATTFAGELVQHDSSHHRFSPFMDEKLYLITSLDDYSRLMLFADLFAEETTWHHIEALRHVCTTYGVPLKYYADQHSIFRYVRDRDTKRPHAEYATFTDDVDPQWKAALKRLGSDVIYALSPQAKGKIERPYRWIQDRLVRTAAKEKLTTLDELREALHPLIEAYNTRWVHSTTKEIPAVRFDNALNGTYALFKPLPNGHDANDLFCLTFKRTTDGYRCLSLDGAVIRLPNARSYTETEIHLASDPLSGLVIARFWQGGCFVEEKRVKISDFKTVRL